MKRNFSWFASLSLLGLAFVVTPACSGGDGAGKGNAATGGSSSGAGAAGMGGTGTVDSNCCEAATEPGCSDENVMSCVCAKNPDCCGAAWDASCVEIAKNSCGTCGGPPVVPVEAGPDCAVGCGESPGGPGTGKPCGCAATCGDEYLSMNCMPAFGQPGTRCICSKMGEISGAFNSTYVGSLCGDVNAVKEAWVGCKFPEASSYKVP